MFSGFLGRDCGIAVRLKISVQSKQMGAEGKCFCFVLAVFSAVRLQQMFAGVSALQTTFPDVVTCHA